MRRLEIEQFIVDQISKFSMTEDFEAAINEIMKEFGLFMKAERVYVFEVGNTHMSNTYEWCAEGVVPQMDNLQSIDNHNVRHWLAELKIGNCIMIDDIEMISETMPEEYAILKMQEIRSCIVVPMILSNHLLGFIGVDNAPIETTRMIRRLLTVVASFIAVSLKNCERRRVLEVMSYTDKMTGCANRNAYISHIESLRRNGSNLPLGVAVCDLNGLKTINDTYGHSAGDRAICSLADGLISLFSAECIFRLGGDEFVILVSDVSREEFSRKIEEVTRLAAEEWKVSVSIGSEWAENCRSPQELVDRADEIMYAMKKKHYEEERASVL
ncbi:MAG: sensor domain-containing diguanylate cyclase [Bacteroides sp.]|nr:sensor domain-containing diguanylate cyclase [Bacteroides sp.]